LYELTEDSVKQNDHQKIELATSTVESYRENQEFGLLAMYYNSIGNYELRDKYVEIAIQEDPSDQNTCYLRGLQGKPELITEDVIERELARYTENKDWTQRARFFTKLGKHREAAADYLQGILESLNEDNIFSAAYYLKEVEKEDLVQELFILALGACANRERIRR
jgi:tetratricopeptide (TPR) repeat protein